MAKEGKFSQYLRYGSLPIITKLEQKEEPINEVLIYWVNRYNIKGKEQLKFLSKYYVVNTSIRNMLVGYSNTDLGHILEIVVYFELLRYGYEVFVGKYGEK